jgi:hypothetical protein
VAKNQFGSDNVVVWCDNNISSSTDYEYGYTFPKDAQEKFAVCTDEKRAVSVAKQMAAKFPGCNVYVCPSAKMLVSKPGPTTTLVIKNGEVIPE